MDNQGPQFFTVPSEFPLFISSSAILSKELPTSREKLIYLSFLAIGSPKENLEKIVQ